MARVHAFIEGFNLYLVLGLMMRDWSRLVRVVFSQSLYWSFSRKVTKWELIEDIAQTKSCEKGKKRAWYAAAVSKMIKLRVKTEKE